MSYIVRPRAALTEYDNLMHELEFVIPNDGSTAASKRDSDLVYGTLYSNITDDTAKTRIRQPSKTKNGRLAWTSIEALRITRRRESVNFRNRLTAKAIPATAQEMLKRWPLDYPSTIRNWTNSGCPRLKPISSDTCEVESIWVVD